MKQDKVMSRPFLHILAIFYNPTDLSGGLCEQEGPPETSSRCQPVLHFFRSMSWILLEYSVYVIKHGMKKKFHKVVE